MGAKSSNPYIQTTKNVRVEWFVGPNSMEPKLWYEIMSKPTFFSKDLVNVMASYALIDNESFSVTNSGYHVTRGDRKVARGTAKKVRCQNSTMSEYDCRDNARFDVRFSWFQPEDRTIGNYWILDVVRDTSPDRYDYALVSNPDGSMVWFLSSTTSMPKYIMDRFMSILRQYQIDTRELKNTRR